MMTHKLEKMAEAGAWLGLGALAMYLLDPAAGRRRRALVRDKLESGMNTTGRTLSARARDAANRGYGMVMETRSRLSERDVPDDVLAERARAAIGHATSETSALELSVRDGVVYARGSVSEEEEREVIASALGRVKGVREVRNELEVRERHATRPESPTL